MKQEYILSWNNKAEWFRLPVNPNNTPTFATEHSNMNFETLDVGAFKAIGKQGLMAVTIEGFFPARWMPFCVVPRSEWRTPAEYVAMLEKWKNSNRPIRLIVTGFLNMAFAIESFEKRIEEGTGDVYFTLAIEEYRFANVSEQGHDAPKKEETGLKERPKEKEKSPGQEVIEVTVKGLGDTLWHLAEVHLKDPLRWKEIQKENGGIDPRSLYVGQKIRIRKGG